MRFGNVIKEFEKHSVSVCGEKGSGKDLLFGNVIARRNKPHIANIRYNDNTIPFKYEDIDCQNTYKNFVHGNIKSYTFPYPDGTDIYFSDCGVYFPSQYCNELNKQYPSIPTFMALSRQLGECSVHTNAQAIQRVWDKMREQSVRYIQCIWTIKPLVKLGIVVQKIRIYDKYESAVNRVRACRVHQPLICFNPQRKLDIQMYRDNFFNTHGEVIEGILIYRNLSKHDTRQFKTMLEGNKTDEV